MSTYSASRRAAVAAVIIVACGVASSHGQPKAAPDQRIAGAWSLDTQASDPAGGGLASDTGPDDTGQHRGPARIGPGGMGMPPGGAPRGSGEGRPDEEQMKRMRELVGELMTPPRRLTIVLGQDTVTFTDERGRTQRYATNWKKEKHQLDAGTIETKTRWEGAELVREIQAGTGLKVTERYAVLPDTSQLQVTAKFEHSREPSSERLLRRVYDSASQE